MPPRKKRVAPADEPVEGPQAMEASNAQAGPSRASTGRRVTFQDHEESDDGDAYEEPAAKKRKTATAAAKKGKGKARKPKKLELFQAMPLDVLVLIMEELDTKTLLAMSRTCSTFRSLLHSDQGAAAWKSARANTGGIPDLRASDLEEWMLASLLFDSTCHVCQKGRAQTVDYVLRARGCAPCMRTNSLRRERISSEASFHSRVWECVPQSDWSSGFDEQVYHFYWLPTVRAVSARLFALDGEAGYDDYLKERRKIKAAAIEDGGALRRWDARYAAHKQDDKRNAAVSRKQKIREKLKELGYEDSEWWLVHDHNLVDQPRDLTDRIWNTIKPQLVHILESDRELKRQHAIAEAMRKRAQKLRPFYDALHQGVASASARSLFPPFGNFLLFEHAKPLYEPEDSDPTAADLAQARQGLLSEADAFAHAIQRAFLGRLVKAHMDLRRLEGRAGSSSSRYVDAPVFSANDAHALAKDVTSVVKCSKGWCWTYATFPAILDHIKVCDSSALTEDALTTSPTQIAAVRHIIESASLKVAETSPSSLYALGTGFQCTECAPTDPLLGAAHWSNAYNLAHEWTGMIRHLLDRHSPPDNRPPSFPPLQFTPSAAKSPGKANPGGFLLDTDSPGSSKGGGAAI
ncbi:hypothetical protein JCM3774_005140 [Rhodotorula dairenensis]